MALPLQVPPAAGVVPSGDHPSGPGEPPAAAPLPRCYRELLSDEANSPAQERLANYMQGYRFNGGPTPVVLRDQTVHLSDRQPMAFLCLVAGARGANEVNVLHRLMQCMDMPGDPESGFHDQVLGLLGDIMPHQYPAVEVPGTAFHLVAAPVRVPTTAGGMLVVLLPTWNHPNTPSLGRYTDQDPETEVVHPRHMQIIPAGYYAALIVHRRGVSAKVAYQEIHGDMQPPGPRRMEDVPRRYHVAEGRVYGTRRWWEFEHGPVRVPAQSHTSAHAHECVPVFHEQGERQSPGTHGTQRSNGRDDGYVDRSATRTHSRWRRRRRRRTPGKRAQDHTGSVQGDELNARTVL